jgi:hypothetical protein
MTPYCLMPPRARLWRAMVGLAPAILGTLFSISAPRRPGTYLDFAREFDRQTGERLAFMQADIIWYDNWHGTHTRPGSCRRVGRER